MKVATDRREAGQSGADVIASGVSERAEKEDGFPRTLQKEDQATGGLIARAWERREFRGKRREVTTFHRPDGKGRVILVGLGPRESQEPETVRRAAAEVIRSLRGRAVRTVGFRLGSFVGERVATDAAIRALVDGAVLGGYTFTKYLQSRESEVEEVTIFLGEDGQREESALKKALEEELDLASAVVWTRDIANLPADTATPERLAEEARKLAKELGLKVTVFDEHKLEEMHCGGILGVGAGSVHPPRLIILEYGGAGRSGKTVAVVGKGITFDSGGISIKPALHMAEMKFDKSGACAVLGIIRAAATLRIPPRVVGVLACAENLPGGSAYRPGDVLRTYNGKTIEILNTDAEGRVVLADALGYVVDKYKPDEVIDLATLTGAQVVALGDDMAGLVANDEGLARGLLDASQMTGEPVWRMPLSDYHRELVKSDIADVRNSTEIAVAGMLTAAAFLETFIGRTAWAHLDIAGPAYTTSTTRKYQPPYQNIGATGFAVRLVTRYLQQKGQAR